MFQLHMHIPEVCTQVYVTIKVTAMVKSDMSHFYTYVMTGITTGYGRMAGLTAI
jgi:hypothetical protein